MIICLPTKSELEILGQKRTIRSTMKKALSILLGVIVITSCNNSKNPRTADNKVVNSTDLPYFIDIEKSLTETKSIPLSSIGKN